jgi:hypothetical protein
MLILILAQEFMASLQANSLIISNSYIDLTSVGNVATEGIPAIIGLSVFTVKVQWNNLPRTITQCLQTQLTHGCTNSAGC